MIEEVQPKQKAIQEKSAETLIIENALREVEVGTVVEYAELSTKIGRDVRTHCYNSMRTALKTLQNESVFFDTVRGVGLKRVSQEIAVGGIGSFARRARNAARAGMRRLASMQYKELTPEAQREHLAASAQLGSVAMFSSTKSLSKIQQVVDPDNGQLPVGKVIELFK